MTLDAFLASDEFELGFDPPTPAAVAFTRTLLEQAGTLLEESASTVGDGGVVMEWDRGTVRLIVSPDAGVRYLYSRGKVYPATAEELSRLCR